VEEIFASLTSSKQQVYFPKENLVIKTSNLECVSCWGVGVLAMDATAGKVITCKGIYSPLSMKPCSASSSNRELVVLLLCKVTCNDTQREGRVFKIEGY